MATTPERRSTLGQWFVRGAGFALGVALIVGVLALARAASSALLLVFVAVTLAAGLEPFIGWIRSRVPIGRGVTILLVYGVFLIAVVALALVALPAATAQLEKTIELLPPFFERVRAWSAGLRPVSVAQGIDALLDGASRLVKPPDTTPTTGQVVQVGLTVAETVASVVTVLTVVYLWIVEHARIQRYALAFVDADRRARARDVWNQIETRLGYWIRGQLILMSAMGLATTVAYTVLGVPGPLLLGLVAALTEAIPLVGPLLGAIPAIIVAATVSPQLALLVAGVYLVLQFLEGNLLVPLVMRNTVGISPFIVILSLLVGGAAGGLLGALFAVPIAAAIEVAIEGLQSREVPVAQDPTSSTSETTEDLSDAADATDAGAVSAG